MCHLLLFSLTREVQILFRAFARVQRRLFDILSSLSVTVPCTNSAYFPLGTRNNIPQPGSRLALMPSGYQENLVRVREGWFRSAAAVFQDVERIAWNNWLIRGVRSSYLQGGAGSIIPNTELRK